MYGSNKTTQQTSHPWDATAQRRLPSSISPTLPEVERHGRLLSIARFPLRLGYFRGLHSLRVTFLGVQMETLRAKELNAKPRLNKQLELNLRTLTRQNRYDSRMFNPDTQQKNHSVHVFIFKMYKVNNSLKMQTSMWTTYHLCAGSWIKKINSKNMSCSTMLNAATLKLSNGRLIQWHVAVELVDALLCHADA